MVAQRPDESVVRNAADPKQVKEGRKAERRRRQEEMDDLRAILRLPGGQRFVWGLLAQGGVYRQSFAGSESHLTDFNEGRRSIGLRVLADVTEADPAALLDMMKAGLPDRSKDEDPEEKDDA
jgi:hypothetical protein